MIPNRLSRRLIEVLFIRRQNDEIIDFMDLCTGAQARPYAVLKALQSLADAGLVNQRRLRLTLEGLALASALLGPAAESRGAAPEPAPPLPGLARCAA
jgi:hypothetical protein